MSCSNIDSVRSTSDSAMASQRLSLLLLLQLLLACVGDVVGQTTNPGDVQALHEAMGAVNFEYDWATIFPDPCTSGPQGIVCAPGDGGESGELLFVTEVQFGYISPIANLIPCSANATLPAEALARLTRLESLAFHSCFTSAPVTIPSSGSLPASLRLLSLTNNPTLGGEIPATVFSSLTSLSRLVLSQNALEGSLPASLTSLASLTQLDLSHNRLAGGIPPLPPSLLNLDLRYNSFSGALPALPASLQRLALSYNNLTGPVRLAALKSLTFLDLSHNFLSGEVALEGLSSLEDLFLNANPDLQGAIPHSLKSFSNLVRVDLSACGFDGAIPELSLRELRFLSVSGNKLSGEIPASLASLPKIFTLNLEGNQLSGPVPFPAAFVKRMGRNLKLGGNAGLCYAPQMVSIKVPLGLSLCAAPVPSPSSPLVAVAPNAAAAVSVRCSFAVILMVVVAILL